MTTEIILAHDEYEQQLFSLRTHSKKMLVLEVNYASIFGEAWKGTKEYGFTVEINTHKILS